MPATISPAAITELRRQIPAWMAAAAVPGLGLALIADGRIESVEGFGVMSRASGQPVDAATLFAAASLSKPPFAYAALALCDEGRLDLDAPLAGYVADPLAAAGLEQDSPDLLRVTLRQVLSHSAGLGNWGDGDRGRLSFAPGSRFAYSGEGYTYAQRVVEAVAGMPLDQFMAARLLGPLGMARSSYVWRPEFAPFAADGHGVSSTGGHRFGQPWAAFSLITTPADYARFVLATLGAGADGPARLSPALAAQLLAPQVAVRPGLSWGLGWGLAGDPAAPIFWHWGDIGDFQCAVVGSRSRGQALVLMTNSEHGLPLCAAIIAAALGQEFAAPFELVIREGW
jgi:CubicO group peptidase (beta-lactamase class C family)